MDIFEGEITRRSMLWVCPDHVDVIQDVNKGGPVIQLYVCWCCDRSRPRTYCLADSDEESSSAGSSDEEDATEQSNEVPGAEG